MTEVDRLRALARYEILDTPPEAMFDRLTRVAASVYSAPIALVSLVDRDRQWFKSARGLVGRETPVAWSFCAHAVRDGGVLVVPDARTDPRFRDNPLVTGSPYIRFYAGAPLEAPDGHRLGTLCVIDSKPRPGLADEHLGVLRDLAAMAVDLMEYRILSGAKPGGARLRLVASRAQGNAS
ncbi:MAG: GAF domain-containing protein [Hyphomicrobiales bacterium]|nr:GAF domain-containing protein [Hyphomicrobiales bacterium]